MTRVGGVASVAGALYYCVRTGVRLKCSEQRLRGLIYAAADAFFVHDGTGRILDCNVEAGQSLGYTREELLSMNVGDITVNLLTEEQRRARAGETLWERVVRGEPGKIVGFDQNELRRRDGTTFPVEVGVGAVEYGGERAIFASARDITARRELENELRQQALHDALTDLPNRVLFMDRLGQALKQTERREKSIAAFFIDLDEFKSVNDDLGHEAGDQLLIGIARRLSDSIRAADTAARLAGDEFTVLLEDLGDTNQAVSVAERILEALRPPFEVKGRQVSIAASIGIAGASKANVAPEELLNRADEAMYRAKETGGSRWEL